MTEVNWIASLGPPVMALTVAALAYGHVWWEHRKLTRKRESRRKQRIDDRELVQFVLGCAAETVPPSVDAKEALEVVGRIIAEEWKRRAA